MPAIKRIASSPSFWMALITIAALGLRLYRLGADCFWFDEIVAQVRASLSPDFPGILAVSRTDAMAVPMDYVVVWLFGRLQHSETFLRLPSALWGTLTIPVAYLLFRQFTSARVALLAVLLLAISPQHVEKSQEARFYASWVFFYLLSTFLLWRALALSRSLPWATFTAVVCLGTLFHVYMSMVLVTGGVWIGTRWLHNRRAPAALRSFLLSSIVITLFFLVSYLLLVGKGGFSNSLSQYVNSLPASIALGMGWLNSAPAVWGYLPLLFLILGLVFIVQAFCQSWHEPLPGLYVAVWMQLGLILLADFVYHYFFSPRQILFLVPFTYLFAAAGLSWIMNRIRRFHLRPLIAGLAIILLAGINAMALPVHYQKENLNYRQLIATLQQYSGEGAQFLVLPDYEVISYRYYFSRIPGADHLIYDFIPAYWKDIPSYPDSTPIYLLLHQGLSSQDLELLLTLGFTRLSGHPYAHDLIWYLSPANVPAH